MSGDSEMKLPKTAIGINAPARMISGPPQPDPDRQRGARQ